VIFFMPMGTRFEELKSGRKASLRMTRAELLGRKGRKMKFLKA